MKALKIIVIVIGVIIAILLVAIAFTSPRKHIERSIVMKATPQAVFEEINSYKSFSQWMPWYAMDPEEKLSFEGPNSGPGAKVTWDGEKVGKGTEWIVSSEENKHVKNQMEFDNFKGVFYADFDLQPVDGGTKVTWSYDGDYTGTGMTNSAKGKFFNWFMGSMIGEQYEKGLQSLKRVVEAKPTFSVKITEEKVSPITYIGLKHQMSPKDLAAVSIQMNKMYSDISGLMKKMKIEATGAPLCVFPKFSEESMEMICGIPVKEGTKINNPKFKLEKTTEGKAVKAVHMGSYNTMAGTHDQISKYMTYKHLQFAGSPWEVYITKPETEKDTSKWVTEIYYPVY